MVAFGPIAALSIASASAEPQSGALTVTLDALTLVSGDVLAPVLGDAAITLGDVTAVSAGASSLIVSAENISAAYAVSGIEAAYTVSGVEANVSYYQIAA